MEKFKAFLKRKDIEISLKRYGIDALGAMAQGLFCSLLIGTIINTIGTQFGIEFLTTPVATVAGVEYTVGGIATAMSGPAMAVAIGYALKCPPLVLFSMIAVGFASNALGGAGGPLAVLFVAIIAAEIGKMVSKETKVDILVTPAVSLIMGGITAKLVGPGLGWCLLKLGDIIEAACEWQPFWFGIFISVVVGLVLTAPISSAALCIMMDLTGLAAGAATAGCCAQMVGFAIASYKDNGVGGLVSQGIGTSMLQVPNIVMHPLILIPPTLAAAITGPISTCIFKMTNNAAGAGMGTSGLVGQIMTLTDMGFTGGVFFKMILVQVVLPAVLSYVFYKVMYNAGWIKDGDQKLAM